MRKNFTNSQKKQGKENKCTIFDPNYAESLLGKISPILEGIRLDSIQTKMVAFVCILQLILQEDFIGILAHQLCGN